MNVYAYAYVEKKEEVSKFKEYCLSMGVPYENIFSDSNKERKNLTKLIRKLEKKDLMYAEDLSAFGESYESILKIWREITEIKQADVCILSDISIDTRKGKETCGSMLADTVSAMLRFVMHNELEKNRKRQHEGYVKAKAKGIRFGRPPKDLPDDFEKTAKEWSKKNISGTEAANRLNMPLSTFRYRAKQLGYHPSA